MRLAEEGFTAGGKVYPLGSLLIYRAENERTVKELPARVANIQKECKTLFYPVMGGFVDKGKDFGSSVYPVLNVPKIAIVSGAETSSQSMGEVWHFFEQDLGYPVTMISAGGCCEPGY